MRLSASCSPTGHARCHGEGGGSSTSCTLSCHVPVSVASRPCLCATRAETRPWNRLPRQCGPWDVRNQDALAAIAAFAIGRASHYRTARSRHARRACCTTWIRTVARRCKAVRNRLAWRSTSVERGCPARRSGMPQLPLPRRGAASGVRRQRLLLMYHRLLDAKDWAGRLGQRRPTAQSAKVDHIMLGISRI